MTSFHSVYRIDKFSVPEGNLSKFLCLVGETHEVLRNQAGFVRDYVVEQNSETGSINVVTFAEWSSAAAYSAAVEAVRRFRKEQGFDTRAELENLGIDSELGVYQDCVVGSARP